MLIAEVVFLVGHSESIKSEVSLSESLIMMMGPNKLFLHKLEVLCTALAALLQYFFTALICWVLILAFLSLVTFESLLCLLLFGFGEHNALYYLAEWFMCLKCRFTTCLHWNFCHCTCTSRAVCYWEIVRKVTTVCLTYFHFFMKQLLDQRWEDRSSTLVAQWCSYNSIPNGKFDLLIVLHTLSLYLTLNLHCTYFVRVS